MGLAGQEIWVGRGKKNHVIRRGGGGGVGVGGFFFWNSPFYTDCMRSSNKGIPILCIDYQFSFTAVTTCSPAYLFHMIATIAANA